MSAQTQIVAAVAGLVSAALGPQVEVLAGRQSALQLGVDRGASVRLLRSIGLDEGLGGGILRWRTDVQVVLRARCQPDQPSHDALEPMLASVIAALVPVPQLPATSAYASAPLIEYDTEEADDTLSHATVTLQIEHYTTAGMAPHN